MKKMNFTLTELAIVLAVTGILLTLALGAVSQGEANTALCADRGRLLQKAWHSYATDFGSGPYSLCGYEGDWRKYHWRDGLRPYLKTAQDDKEWRNNFWCPEIDRFKTGWISINTGIAPLSRGAKPPRLEDFKQPDLTVVMADSKWDTYTAQWGGSFTSRHDDGNSCNFFMADGSVQRERTLSEIAFDGENRVSYPPLKFYYTAAAAKTGWPGMDYKRYQ